MTDLTPEQVASVNVGYWAQNLYQIRLQTGPFSFKDHEYQLEPMTSKERRKCVRKATQGGFTECEVIDSLHGMRYGHLPQGVLYLFPTTDDVNEFAKSRFNPLLANNRKAIGQYVKSGGSKGTDTASLKKIFDSFLYLRGARLSQKISDLNESSKLKGIPVDRVVFDEVDHMDEDVITKAIGRMGHSKVKQERYLSNPLVPGEGIDKIFQMSDQRYWFRKCSCGKFTCAEMYFTEDPEACVGIRDDGTGFIRCQYCGKEVFIKDGHWEAQYKDNSNYMHGYHWSQLSSAFNDPKEILDQFRDPPHGNLADIYRLRLGLPYIAAEDRLTRAQVFECCNDDGMSSSDSGPCAMGVDVGEIKHVIIGKKTGNDQYTIVKIAQFKGLEAWSQIHDLARRFNVRSAVIDIRPDTDIVRQFQKQEPYPIFLCEYSDNPAYTRTWDTDKKIVKDYRTALFDETHRMVIEPGCLTIPRSSIPEVKEFAKQLCDAYKLLEVNKRTGARAYRYKGKKEHYRNALNYFILAASKSRIARAGASRNRQKRAINNAR